MSPCHANAKMLMSPMTLVENITLAGMTAGGIDDELEDIVSSNAGFQTGLLLDFPKPVVAATQTHPKLVLRMAILIMVLSGSLLDFLGKTIYTLMPSPRTSSESSIVGGWLVMILTLGSLLASAIPPWFQKQNRASVRENMERLLALQLLAASSLDVLVVGGRYLALMFLPPAVCAIMKASTQLIALALINHLRGKSLTIIQWSSLGGALIGDLVTSVAEMIQSSSEDNFVGGRTLLGIAIITLSGVSGACRNVIEEMILHNRNLTDGALMMLETGISACIVFAITLLVGLVIQFRDLEMTREVFMEQPGVLLTFGLFLIASYGKDAGHFKIVKCSTSLTSKLMGLLFPCGSWLICLGAYSLSRTWRTSLGEGWVASVSWIRLVGLIVMLGSCAVFINQASRR